MPIGLPITGELRRDARLAPRTQPRIVGVASLRRRRPGHQASPLPLQDRPRQPRRGRARAGRHGRQRAVLPSVGVRSSMSELFDAWYAIASVNWFPNTVRQNRSVLRRHLHPRFGQVKVGDLTPAMIEAVYADLQRHGSVLGGPLAAGTVARIHVMLRSSLSPRDALGLDLGQSRRTHLSDRGARPGDLTTQPGRGRSTPPPCRTARSRPPFVDHLGYGDRSAPRSAARTALERVRFATRRLQFCRGWVEGQTADARGDEEQASPQLRPRPRPRYL